MKINNETNSGWVFFGKIIAGIIFVIGCTFLVNNIKTAHSAIKVRPDLENFNFKVTWNNHAPVYTNYIELLPDGKIWFRGIDRYDAGPPYDTLDMTLSGTYQIENLK